MKFNPFRSPKIKKMSKPAKVKIAGEKNPAERAEGTERVNRTVYLTVAVLLIVLAVAVAMTSAANRARKGQSENTQPPETTLKTPDTLAPAPETESPVPQDTAPPADTNAGEQTDVPAAAELPVLSLPAKGILGKEHDPTVQVFSNTLGEWRVHLGIDIMTEAAAPVYAAAAGKITQIADDPMWGRCIWIEHDAEAVTVYRGLADELPEGIEVGAKVTEKSIIGAVGEGGVLELADEPHLHFEMKIKGADVDPLEYFSKTAIETLSKKTETVEE